MNNRRNELLLVSAREYCKCVVEGKTIKYNQKTSANNISNESYYGMSVNCSNGIITITGTSTFVNGDINIYTIFNYFVSVANHKYISISSNSKFRLLVYNGVQDFYSFGDEVFTPNFSDDLYVALQPRDTSYIANGLTLNETITCMVIDLTELGLDNVNSVGEFYETDLGKYILKGNYLSATNGAFIQAKTPINFNGVNIWNEQWENGIWYNGTKYTSGYDNYICSKDKIKVKPNTQYFYFNGSSAYDTYIALSFFDNNGAFIQQIYVNAKNSFTTPINCRFIAFYVNDTYGNVYNHDICINEYNIDYNRKYHKYCGTNVLMEGLILQKGDKYKSWNGNLTRTMKEIDLSTLTWTWEGDYWDADISNIDDIKKYYQSDETPNAIAEKYRVVSVNQDTQEGYPVGNLVIEGSEFSGYYIEINSNDSQNAPSGKMLIELLQPTTTMWQTLYIQDYNDFVTTDTPNIYKLNIDLSDYGVLDVTSDNGAKMSNLTQLNIFGGDGDFCYQDGYIYQKSSDIENAWIYQIQISSAPSRMVSRRTINVESNNDIDLDFTKE